MTNKEQIILGVDPGTRVTGYGVIKWDGRSLTPLDFGCIKPPPKYKLTDRYLVIFESMEEVVKKWSPDAMSVESQFLGGNVLSMRKLSMALTAALLSAKKHGVSVYEYAPKKAKIAVTGNGGASKMQVQIMVGKLLKLKEIPEPEDAADALALAICHVHGVKWGKEI
ncbi:crossover junction endodeoxyribonuclease RuvC [Chlamydiales bacterium]|nr:crossover junction endodeoxyribonuclease RuvC [Chlamydiales bacterium]